MNYINLMFISILFINFFTFVNSKIYDEVVAPFEFKFNDELKNCFGDRVIFQGDGNIVRNNHFVYYNYYSHFYMY